MFEKTNVQVFTWNERLSNDCSDELVKSLEGKPITLTVAGVKMTVGFVRKVRRGRDGVFADLVIYMEEAVHYITDADGKISEFTAVILKPETAEIEPLPKTEEKEDCPVCGLPIDLCICKELAKEEKMEKKPEPEPEAEPEPEPKPKEKPKKRPRRKRSKKS